MTHTTTTTTTRRTRTLVALATLLLLPGALTACSGGTPDDHETKPAGAGAGATTASCMRDKGYDMDDPSTSDGGMKVSIPDGVDKEQWQEDMDACLGDDGGAGGSGMAKPAPGVDAKSGQVAKCIRDAGFSDYPDDMDARSKYRAADQDAFETAAQECSDEAFGDDATGATR
ncbi:hypothetical protein [Curtobacterium pusillum]|uniref:hypothetical protein n=1 Tax=Curtobacterium pusillum TaxID=69373 RepID=UPI00119DC1C9|nr:hypothetical protein [Curtobacterium pusillum]